CVGVSNMVTKTATANRKPKQKSAKETTPTKSPATPIEPEAFFIIPARLYRKLRSVILSDVVSPDDVSLSEHLLNEYRDPFDDEDAAAYFGARKLNATQCENALIGRGIRS